MSLLTGTALPPGYGTVNPFVLVRGADGYIRFLGEVFGGVETAAARTPDADGLLIHAEVRVGDSTIMLADTKPHWGSVPALLQVYLADLDGPVALARSRGAEVITEPTPFHGGQRLARLRDPWDTLWWLFEYGPESVAPSERAPGPPAWTPDPTAPPSYVFRTLDEALSGNHPRRE
ncbi:VOC family protein [Actinomycetospora sp. OC33-EN08]|uniref:VOC family protein n=1 Tax=Actinomycetospora aurantiaca TaxID=3129233 RepID=A0ABU8MJV0_9PSEU